MGPGGRLEGGGERLLAALGAPPQEVVRDLGARRPAIRQVPRPARVAMLRRGRRQRRDEHLGDEAVGEPPAPIVEGNEDARVRALLQRRVERAEPEVVLYLERRELPAGDGGMRQHLLGGRGQPADPGLDGAADGARHQPARIGLGSVALEQAAHLDEEQRVALGRVEHHVDDRLGDWLRKPHVACEPVGDGRAIEPAERPGVGQPEDLLKVLPRSVRGHLGVACGAHDRTRASRPAR